MSQKRERVNAMNDKTENSTETTAKSIGAADTSSQQDAPKGQSEKSAGFPLKLSQDHTHAGVDYKAGQTIALDPAEYRWATDNHIGTAGSKDDIGK
jgi:hypothetical protein